MDEPAFPQPGQIDNYWIDPPSGTGMTLRDYFAAKVLQGEIAAQSNDEVWLEAKAELLAKRCYAFADAMLAARQSEERD